MKKEKWSPRVPMEWLARLYEADAAGIVDEELIDKVGYRLYERCRDCLTVTDYAMGRVAAPMDAPSWRHMEMVSEGMRDFFETFVSRWESARSAKEKMLAVDDVIHRWHWENRLAERGAVGRPGGVNLIEGSRKQVLAFLDRLSAGPSHERWSSHYGEVKRSVRR
jgi:hypothetical protein